MSHRTSTTVTHWIVLDEREQFDFPNHNGSITYRALHLTIRIIDGSLSSFVVTGARVMKNGGLSTTTTEKRFWDESEKCVLYPLLRRRGIPTPDRAR